MPHLLAGGIGGNDVTYVPVPVVRVQITSEATFFWFKYESMIIQIKMDIKRNHAIIKYFKSYIAVIILVNLKKKSF